jgi:hypothetical protein
MTGLWAGRGLRRHDAASLRPPRWRRVRLSVLALWSARLPVGYGVTGSRGRPGTQDTRRNTAAGPGGDTPGAAWVAPPPLPLPGEPTPLANTPSPEHHQRSEGVPAPLTRQRVVLLPHSAIKPTDTPPRHRRVPE